MTTQCDVSLTDWSFFSLTRYQHVTVALNKTAKPAIQTKSTPPLWHSSNSATRRRSRSTLYLPKWRHPTDPIINSSLQVGTFTIAGFLATYFIQSIRLDASIQHEGYLITPFKEAKENYWGWWGWERFEFWNGVCWE